MKLIKFGNYELSNYKDYTILAHEGLHEDIAEIIQDLYKGQTNISVFDVASGPGAFSQRLVDAGFNVESSDLDKESFVPKNEIPFHQLDLNSSTQLEEFMEKNRNKFDLAVSLETIEHIENPWLFMRFLKGIVKPGGKIIISTPNIESIYSRFSFFFTSKFHQFYDVDLSYGHINPMTSWEIKNVVNYTGLKLEKVKPVGVYPIFHLRLHKILFSTAWSIMNALFYPLLKGRKTGWALCYIIEKPA